MDARHLALLRELADRGTVAQVAAATHRTPSAVSQQLRTAERELGVRLVEPDGRGIRLTDEARLLAEAAVDVDIALARAQRALDERRGSVAGKVTVTGLPSAVEYLLPPALVALADTSIQVVLDDIDVAEVDFAAYARDVDIVIAHSLEGPVPAGSAGLVTTVLCREPIDVALPPDHRLAGRASVRAEDVVDEPWIGVPIGFPYDVVRHGIERVTGRRTDIRQRLRDNRSAAALVAAGLGVALLPRFTESRYGDVVLIPLEDVPAVRWVVAISRPDRSERAAVRAVVAALRHASPGPQVSPETEH